MARSTTWYNGPPVINNGKASTAGVKGTGGSQIFNYSQSRTGSPIFRGGKTQTGNYDPARAAANAARDAENRAIARENAAKTAAGNRSLEQAKNLEAQAKALEYALNTAFQQSLDQNLADVGVALEQQMKLLKDSSASRAQAFLDTAGDTDMATGQQSESSFGNLIRERQDTMAGLMQHGAGETDALRAMVMAARNFQGNLEEGNRAYYDTMRTINNGITDLNRDTQNALSNAHMGAESERERLWQNFYDRRSETWTQLGNIRGQQRDYYAQAKEMGVQPGQSTEDAAKSSMEEAYMNASKEAGKSYVQQALPSWISDYEGQEQVEAKQQNTNLANSTRFSTGRRASGASLRKWAA